MKTTNKVSGVTVQLHPAERCQNELAYVKKSWFDPERFNVIAKWMAVYYCV